MTTVLGGGLAGLSAGYYFLRSFGEAVTIYESSTRIGGWIRSERHRDRGFIFEAGPRTIRPKGAAGANTLEMIQELQVPVHGIRSKHVAARNRLVYAKGELCLLPNSLTGIFRTRPPFTRPIISSLLSEWRAIRKEPKLGDESIYDFTKRRFGAEIAEYAISPMICGICAGDAKEISVRFLMDDLFEKEQKFGSITKGIFYSKLMSDKKSNAESAGIFEEPMPTLYDKACKEKWSMYGVENGLEMLPRTLGAYLRKNDVDIQLSAECQKIKFTNEGVKLQVKGREVSAKNVISALPSYKLAACVRDQHPSLAALLHTITYVDVAVVNLQYNAKDVLKQNAFGFLVPPVERLPILGVIFDSCCFDMHDNTVLTVMMGGRWFEQHFGKSPSPKELLDTALTQVDKILGINMEPKMTRVNVLHKCIPQYTVGHRRRVNDIRRYIERYDLPLKLCGAAFDGVGINDVVLSARRQVESLSLP